MLLGLRRWAPPSLPGPLLVIALGILLAAATGLASRGVALVGAIPHPRGQPPAHRGPRAQAGHRPLAGRAAPPDGQTFAGLLALWMANMNERPLDMLRRSPEAGRYEPRLFRELDDAVAAFAAPPTSPPSA
jgi:hypothetical protein